MLASMEDNLRGFERWGLATLVESIGVDSFLEEFWPRRLFVGHGSLDRLSPLSRIPEVNDVESFLSAARSDVEVWPPRQSPDSGFRRASPNAALELYHAGWTIYSSAAEACVPSLRPLIRTLASELGLAPHELATEVFFSQAGAGTLPHCDWDLGFNLQLRGRKLWQAAPNRNFANPHASIVIANPFESTVQAYSNGPLPHGVPSEGRVEFVAEPGTVVFLPRGYWHMTRAQDPSIALTFTWKGTMWFELMARELATRLRMFDRWRAFRAHQPGARDRTRAENLVALDGLLRDLGTQVQQLSAAELLAAWDCQPEQLYRLPARSRLSFIQKTPAVIEGALLRFVDPDGRKRFLTLPVSHATVARSVARIEKPFSAVDLATLGGCSELDAQLIIDALVREHALEAVSLGTRTADTPLRHELEACDA